MFHWKRKQQQPSHSTRLFYRTHRRINCVFFVQFTFAYLVSVSLQLEALSMWLPLCTVLFGCMCVLACSLARSLMCVCLCACCRVFRSVCLVEIIQMSMLVSVSRFQFEAWIHAPNSFYFLRPRFISCVHACFMVALMQFAMRFWSTATWKMNSVRWIQLKWWTANTNINVQE